MSKLAIRLFDTQYGLALWLEAEGKIKAKRHTRAEQG